MKKCMRLILIILIVLPVTIVSSSLVQVDSQSSNATYLPVHGYSKSVYYSKDSSNSKLDIFVSYMSTNIIHTDFYSYKNSLLSNSINNSYPQINYIDPSSTNVAPNYFISNKIQFLAISSYFFTNSFTLVNMNNNLSYEYQSQYYYVCSGIFTFNDSPDVYFVFYNVNSLTIARYSFDNNSFSTFFNQSVSNPSSLENINVFMSNDHLYVSFQIDSSQNTDFFVYIFNNTNQIFNKRFYSQTGAYISPTNNGFLLYSLFYGYFYSYYIKSNSLIKLNYYPAIYGWNSINNNSIIFYEQNKLIFMTIDNTFNSTILTEKYVINLPSNDTVNSISTFNLDSINYYILNVKMENYNSLISINPDYQYPTGLNILNQSNYSSNNSISTIQTTNLVVTGNTVLGPVVFLFIFIVVVIIIASFAFYTSIKKEKVNNNFQTTSSLSFNNKNLSNEKDNTTVNSNSGKVFCLICGSSIYSGDIFCQNCGARI